MVSYGLSLNNLDLRFYIYFSLYFWIQQISLVLIYLLIAKLLNTM